MAKPIRSRDGCGNCRRRKRKCDETRPGCDNCSKRNVACDGYEKPLRWDVGVASRGYLTGAAIPDPNSVAPRQKGRQRDIIKAQKQEHEQTPPPPQQQQPLQSNVLQSCLPTRTEEDQARFVKFLESDHLELFSSTVDDSPLRDLIPHLIQHSDALFEVCVTMHLLISEHETETFYTHYDKALLAFRNELARYDGNLNAGTLCAGLLLCTVNIYQGSPWTAHLASLQRLLWTSSQASLQLILSKPANHFVEVMSIMDMPTFVIGRQHRSLGIWKQFRHLQEESGGKERGIAPVSGLPRSLLDLFAEIEKPGIAQEFFLWPGEPGNVLQQQLWEAYRFAGILNSHRIHVHQGTSPVVNAASPSRITMPDYSLMASRLLSSLLAVHLGLQSSVFKDLLIANAVPYPVMALGTAASDLGDLGLSSSEAKVFQEIVDTYIRAEPDKNSNAMLEILNRSKAHGGLGFNEHQAAREMNFEIALF